MARKRRGRRRGFLSGASRKVKSYAGTGIEIAGGLIVAKPLIDSAVEANAAGGDIGQKFQGFVNRVQSKYTAQPDGITAAFVGAVVMFIGKAVKRM